MRNWCGNWTFLSQVERPQIIQELLEAAQEGVTEKNTDFFARPGPTATLDRRIRQLQQTLANAEVLVGSNLPPNQVRFNSRVRVLNLSTGREKEFKLVCHPGGRRRSGAPLHCLALGPGPAGAGGRGSGGSPHPLRA